MSTFFFFSKVLEYHDSSTQTSQTTAQIGLQTKQIVVLWTEAQEIIFALFYLVKVLR